MSSIEFLYLCQEDVVKAGGLDMKMVVEGMERAFKLYNAGQVIIPNKIVMTFPPGERERGRINGLAAYIAGDWEVAGIKWIPGFPNNPTRHKLPRANAFMILNDTQTGMPQVIMDGTILSAMRTGAIGGGLGGKYLARKDSEVAAIMGMGVQARTQAMALKVTLPKLKEIRGYDILKGRAPVVLKDIEKLTGLRTKACDTPKEAIEGADVIDTVTVADEPIVKDTWLKKGVTCIHMGSYIEEEYDVVLKSDKIVADDWDTVKHRKTPILARMYDEGKIKDTDLYANLDEIVAGKKKGRENDNERIFFSPIGMAHEDVAVASLIYERAKREGIGQKLKLWTNPMWV
jgi:ornithine cyclodeaminase/alanine dehydrogenase-like protein (mu-crystallin family)